jgi:hypothetical protein
MNICVFEAYRDFTNELPLVRGKQGQNLVFPHMLVLIIL